MRRCSEANRSRPSVANVLTSVSGREAVVSVSPSVDHGSRKPAQMTLPSITWAPSGTSMLEPTATITPSRTCTDAFSRTLPGRRITRSPRRTMPGARGSSATSSGAASSGFSPSTTSSSSCLASSLASSWAVAKPVARAMAEDRRRAENRPPRRRWPWGQEPGRSLVENRMTIEGWRPPRKGAGAPFEHDPERRWTTPPLGAEFHHAASWSRGECGSSRAHRSNIEKGPGCWKRRSAVTPCGTTTYACLTRAFRSARAGSAPLSMWGTPNVSRWDRKTRANPVRIDAGPGWA